MIQKQMRDSIARVEEWQRTEHTKVIDEMELVVYKVKEEADDHAGAFRYDTTRR